MSIGDLKTNGDKGNNFPWQLKMLLGQQCACDELTAIADNTDNVEFLLTAILTSLQAQTDYEARFVLETCPGPITRVLLEVRVWDQDSGTWGPITYYLPGSTTPVVIDPGCTLEYTDPTGMLAMIYNELLLQTPILTAIEADTTSIDATLTAQLDVPLSTISTEVTLLTRLSKADFEARINTFGQKLMAESTPIVIASNQSAIPVTFGGGSANTSYYNRSVGSGLVVALGAISISVQNIGPDNITMITDSSPSTIIDPGVSLTFDAGIGKSLGAFSFLHSTASSLYIVTQVR